MSKIVLEDFNEGNGYYKVNLAYLNMEQVEEIETLVSTWKPTDEDIKSCIQMCLTDANEHKFKDYGTNLKDCLAWLEKQGQTFTKKDVDDAYLKGISDTKNEIEKQGQQDDYDDNIITRDDEILQAISIGLTDAEKDLGWSDFGGLPIEEIHAWLEKQGEQKSIDDLTQQEAMDIAVAKCFEQGEQKPSDKVEPKFHEGEWVVNKFGDSWHIDSFNKENYQVSNGKGNFNWFPIAKQDEMRLWTIEDAKDGDVLCYKDEISLYKHDIKNCTKQEATFGGFVYHCCYDGKRFIMDSLYSLTEQDKMDIHPATKEQRDLLFKKMKEAGYEWDENKKELRKIEQKLSNSANIGKNDTLLDLLHKMPSCITVNGIDYHFVMKKTITFMAFYEGEGEKGRDKIIFWMAGDPIAMLTVMLEKLKKEGLLE